MSLRSWLPLVLVALVASLLLFRSIGARYLWQDEAACAVMAERMMETGLPYAYRDGNLITMDVFEREEGPVIDGLTATPEKAIAHFVENGDFGEDTVWIGQPWAQFVLAGVSMELFGRGTVSARLPFVVAAVLTAVLLFGFVRKRFDDPLMAGLSVVFLLGSVYWFLHARQCRYYSTATLFLLLTLVTYVRWQDGARWGATLFVVTAWVWFHNDFGSFWPVMGVLTVDAFLRAGRAWKRTFLVLAALGAAVLPFVFVYALHTRFKEPIAPWGVRTALTLYYGNHYLMPLLFLPVAFWMTSKARFWRPGERRLVGIALAIVVAQLVWMPLVGPMGFYRYVVDLTPLACLVMAFVLVRLFRPVVGELARPALRRAGTLLAAAFVLASPLAAWATTPGPLIPERYRVILPPLGVLVRGEWRAYAAELAGDSPDPNRAVVERLAPLLEPGDEIAINYEDAPLMFYLPGHRIRGGLQCFRLMDRSEPEVRFLVMRPRIGICHREAYQRFVSAHRWRQLPRFEVPEMPWGNNPDPSGHFSRFLDEEPTMQLFENRRFVDE